MLRCRTKLTINLFIQLLQYILDHEQQKDFGIQKYSWCYKATSVWQSATRSCLYDRMRQGHICMAECYKVMSVWQSAIRHVCMTVLQGMFVWQCYEACLYDSATRHVCMTQCYKAIFVWQSVIYKAMSVWQSAKRPHLYGSVLQAMSVWQSATRSCLYGRVLQGHVCVAECYKAMSVWQNVTRPHLYGRVLQGHVCMSECYKATFVWQSATRPHLNGRVLQGHVCMAEYYKVMSVRQSATTPCLCVTECCKVVVSLITEIDIDMSECFTNNISRNIARCNMIFYCKHQETRWSFSLAVFYFSPGWKLIRFKKIFKSCMWGQTFKMAAPSKSEV